MKHTILLIIATIFSLQTISAIDSERTSKAVAMLISEVVDNAQNISETNNTVFDKKLRRKERLAHIAKIIKAVTLALIEILAASKDGKIKLTRSAHIHHDDSQLQQDMEIQLRHVLREMLDEIDEIEQEETAE